MKKFRISEIYRDYSRILMAVECIAVHHGNSDLGCWMHGSIEANAIIVLDQEHTFAYDSDAKPISIEQLSKDIPELDALIPELNERIKPAYKF